MLRKLISLVTAFFFFVSIFSPQFVQAQSIVDLPVPGTMVSITSAFNPILVTGMTLYPENPMEFDFFLDRGDAEPTEEEFYAEAQKMIHYFMTTLTVPDEEMWVNLSPYEKDRIIAKGLGQTEMGRDMLAQDYMLKQLASSLMYPKDELGKKFWEEVYAKANDIYGTVDIPTETFNKVWIVPDQASVYVNGHSVFVSDSHLSVMLEEDYLAMEMNQGRNDHGLGAVSKEDLREWSPAVKDVIRKIIIPAIEQEVNHGKTFANLRQIYNSMLLATWYKRNLKKSFLGQVYLDQNKVQGIDLAEEGIKEKIYNQYVEAFKAGVYDYIQDEYDPKTNEIIPRKYFSGGLDRFKVDISDAAELAKAPADIVKVSLNRAMLNFDVISLFENELLRDEGINITDKDDLTNNLETIKVLKNLGVLMLVNGDSSRITFTDLIRRRIVRDGNFSIIKAIQEKIGGYLENKEIYPSGNQVRDLRDEIRELIYPSTFGGNVAVHNFKGEEIYVNADVTDTFIKELEQSQIIIEGLIRGNKEYIPGVNAKALEVFERKKQDIYSRYINGETKQIKDQAAVEFDAIFLGGYALEFNYEGKDISYQVPLVTEQHIDDYIDKYWEYIPEFLEALDMVRYQTDAPDAPIVLTFVTGGGKLITEKFLKKTEIRALLQEHGVMYWRVIDRIPPGTKNNNWMQSTGETADFFIGDDKEALKEVAQWSEKQYFINVYKLDEALRQEAKQVRNKRESFNIVQWFVDNNEVELSGSSEETLISRKNESIVRNIFQSALDNAIDGSTNKEEKISVTIHKENNTAVVQFKNQGELPLVKLKEKLLEMFDAGRVLNVEGDLFIVPHKNSGDQYKTEFMAFLGRFHPVLDVLQFIDEGARLGWIDLEGDFEYFLKNYYTTSATLEDVEKVIQEGRLVEVAGLTTKSQNDLMRGGFGLGIFDMKQKLEKIGGGFSLSEADGIVTTEIRLPLIDQASLHVGKSKISPVDNVALKGGIDFNANGLNLKEQGGQFQFNFPEAAIDPAQLDNFHGFRAVIQSIQPIKNFSISTGKLP